MAQGRIGEAAEAMAGRVIAGDPAARWSGAAIDSRRVRGGELFFALPGERSDGHLFVGEALERGAAGAVVHRPVEAPEGAALIEVEETFAALRALAAAVRERLPERLVAVTGSSGKTTTKELLAAMLGRRYRVARNPGNLNNLYGFPLALLGIAEESEWMVAEMGMSTPGELGKISRLGRPDVAVFTNVRPVHLEFFDDLRAITEAKAELLEGLAADGLVVANADDPEVVRIARRHPGRIVWYGLEGSADYGAEAIRPAAPPAVGYRFRLTAEGESREMELPLYGRFNLENCLAAAACAHALGVPLDDVAAAAAAAAPVAQRGVVHRLADGTVIVDESYNSNPDALRQALAGARELSEGRRWAVLGEMLELGREAERYHREAGAAAAAAGFSPVLGVGELARALAAAAAGAGARSGWHPDAEGAAAAAAGELRPGDLVLIKGSRGVGLERVVERLLGAPGDRPTGPGGEA